MKTNQFLAIKLSMLFCVVFLASFMTVVSADEEATKPTLIKQKQTSLGLYVNSKEAYDKWLAAPEEIKILDVRTFEEYLFIGHAPMAWNIPLAFQTQKWDADKGRFAMQPNSDFVSEVKKIANPEDTLLVMCRSGGRSAMAVDMLAEAGFTNVYTITDGVEGDTVKDPDSVFQGQRLRNGWKNSGLPLTYEMNPKLLPTIIQQDKEAGKE